MLYHHWMLDVKLYVNPKHGFQANGWISIISCIRSDSRLGICNFTQKGGPLVSSCPFFFLLCQLHLKAVRLPDMYLNEMRQGRGNIKLSLLKLRGSEGSTTCVPTSPLGGWVCCEASWLLDRAANSSGVEATSPKMDEKSSVSHPVTRKCFIHHLK